MLTSLDTIGPIDVQNPINVNHPLNKGRIAWWIAVPQIASGNTWFDLTGQFSGVLTAMGNSTSGWRSPTRPGSQGQMLFNGTTSAIAIPSGIFGLLSNKIISVAAWIFPAGNLTSYQAVFDTSTSAATRQLSVFLGATASQVFVAIAGATGGAIVLSSPLVLNAWQRFMLTCDGTTVRIYANGALIGSSAVGILGTGFVPAALQFGVNPSGGGAAFVGAIDDASMWNRQLSALEIQEDYNLSRIGYPGLLNRYPAQRMVANAGTVGTSNFFEPPLTANTNAQMNGGFQGC